MIQPISKSQRSSARRKARDKSAKAIKAATSDKPVQLTFFDYAARIGVPLLPDAS